MIEKTIISKKKKHSNLKTIIETKFNSDERLDVWIQLQTLINSKK